MLTLLELPLDLTDLTDCLDMVDTVEALRVTEAECCLLGMLDTVDCLLGRGLVWGNIGMVGIENNFDKIPKDMQDSCSTSNLKQGMQPPY